MKQAKEHVAATEDARAQLVEVQGQVDRACKDKQRLVRVWTSMLKTLQQRDKMLLVCWCWCGVLLLTTTVATHIHAHTYTHTYIYPYT